MLNLFDRLSKPANAESVERIQDEPGPRLFAVRQARSADSPAIRDFLAGLSLRTRYLRFFTGAPSTSTAMLRLLAGDGAGLDVVLATQAGAIIGHGMAADAAGRTGPSVAEIGVVVADERQGQGVGSALIRALADRALDRGITLLAMDVLPENKRVLAMIAGRWPEARYRYAGDCVTIRAPLRAEPTLASPTVAATALPAPALAATALASPALASPALPALALSPPVPAVTAAAASLDVTLAPPTPASPSAVPVAAFAAAAGRDATIAPPTDWGAPVAPRAGWNAAVAAAGMAGTRRLRRVGQAGE